MDNMTIWEKGKQPPANALKQIQAGRLRGKTDINPQWRYQMLTEIFGPCGVGWMYEIKELWTIPAGNELIAYAKINLYFLTPDDGWSSPIPGIGGSKAIAAEKDGLYVNDECYKMAVTDALSVACKMLGLGADVYAGRWDGTKYHEEPASKKAESKAEPSPKKGRQPGPTKKKRTDEEILADANKRFYKIWRDDYITWKMACINAGLVKWDDEQGDEGHPKDLESLKEMRAFGKHYTALKPVV